MATSTEKLPRQRIIRRRSVFDAARTKGRRISNRWMTLSVLPRHPEGGANEATVAFLTPKRIGVAVVRNRLRRRMREIFRRDLNFGTRPLYLIWIARPPAVELNLVDLRIQMLKLGRRALPARRLIRVIISCIEMCKNVDLVRSIKSLQ